MPHINQISTTMRLVSKVLKLDPDSPEGEEKYTRYWDLLENVTEGQLKYLQALTYNKPEEVQQQLNEWELFYTDSDNHPALERE